MQLNSKAMKRPAWQSMRAAVPSALLVTLVYFLLTDVLSNVVSLFTPTVTVEDLLYGRGAGMWAALFLSILLSIYQMVMDFGYSTWALHTARGQQAGYGSLLNGFGMVDRVLWMKIRIALGMLGWTLLLSMVYAVFLLFIGAIFGNVSSVFLVLVVILSLAFYVGVIAITLRYELAPFLLYDYPEAGGATAVRRSVEMMRGHIWQLFKLLLSFWPWFVAELFIELAVCAIVLVPLAGELIHLFQYGNLDALTSTIQIAMDGTKATVLLLAAALPLDLFYRPYMRISIANFYRALSQEPVNPSFSGETF